MKEKVLTPKQEKFAVLYVEIGNASQAYRQSYNCEHMKMATVNNKAYGLLQKGDIRARVEELKREMSERAMIRKEQAIEILTSLGTVNIGEFYYEDEKTGKMKLKRPYELSKSAQAAVKSYDASKGKYELYDKSGALKTIGEWCGWNADKNVNLSVPGKDGKNILRIGYDDEE